jgi:putative addiction module antidote
MAKRKTQGVAGQAPAGVAEQTAAHDAGTRTLKIRAVGNSLGAVVPRDILAKLGAGEGDELRIIESPLGVVILRNSARLAETHRIVGEIIERDRKALAALSKR